MEDPFLQDEIDDINCATQLSLLDLNETHENPEEDEVLARAIEESLKSSSKNRSRESSSSSYTTRCLVHCDVCNEVLSSGIYGRLEFWNQRFCPHHIRDGTPICCGCNRLKRLDVEYFDLGEERTICPDCYSTCTKKTQELEPLRTYVLQFFQQKCMNFDTRVPIFLVTRDEMRRHTRQGTTLGPIHPNTLIFGLTVPLGEDGISVRSVTCSSLQGRKIIVGETEHETSSWSEIVVMVLFGLPMIMTGAILAHEMMHVWLRLTGVKNLDPKVCEGICQVIGYEWLDWFEGVGFRGFRGSSSIESVEYTRNLKATFKHRVELDSSPAYGDGFRDAKHSVAKYGLRKVINYIKTYGNIPN